MKKFRDVLSRWELGELSMMEAGELLGMSERQFRRYRGRYEEDGAEGLVDRRLGKPSRKRVPAATITAAIIARICRITPISAPPDGAPKVITA
jgi:Winged helix-turn helix